jgi:prepilin-type N-terminal cleavage/methylation domain-containing protein
MMKLLSGTYRKLKNKEGFTLVELIVVIAIMVVLISLLVPNIIGYIKKANRTAALADAKSIVTGAQNALIYKARECNLTIDKKYKVNGKDKKIGGITNTAINNTLNSTGKTNQHDLDIASAIIDMVSIAALDQGDKAVTGGKKPFGMKGEEYIKAVNGEYGIILLYNSYGQVPFMQIYRNGVLVTYANGYWAVNDDKDVSFIKKGAKWSQPFIDAGMKASEVDDSLKITTMTGW